MNDDRYVVNPMHSNSIHSRYEMTRSDGSKWFNIEVMHRDGVGHIYDEANLPHAGDMIAYCSINSKLGEEVRVNYEFSDAVTEQEQTDIKQIWDDAGEDGLYEMCENGEWELLDACTIVVGPFTVDIHDEDGWQIAENIELKPEPVFENANNQWPVDTTLHENIK